MINPQQPTAIVVALGPILERTREALALLGARGINIALWSTAIAKPISEKLLTALREQPGVPVVTLEEGAVPGGFGSRLRAQAGNRDFHEWGYPDRFLEHATPEEQDFEVELTAPQLVKRLLDILP